MMTHHWVIVDTDPEHSTIRLLQVGDTRYPGKSVRKNLPKHLRYALHQHLENAAFKGQGFDDVEVIEGTRQRVYVEPVCSPYSGVPVGAYGTVVPVEERLPAKPHVGALEWRISDHREIYWDESLVALYSMHEAHMEHVPGTNRAVYRPSPEWLIGFVDAADQDKLQRLIDAAAQGPFRGIVTVSYTIHPSGLPSRVVELTARNTRDTDGTTVFLGMVREVPEQFDPIIPEALPAPADQAAALIELMPDVPLTQIRADTGELVQSFPSWEDAGLPSLHEHDVRDLIDPSRHGELDQILGSAETERPVTVMHDVPLRCAAGEQITVDLWLKRLGGQYVMIRVARV